MRERASRREILKGSAAVLALAGSGTRARAEAAGGFKLGVATYSLRKFSREQAIGMLRELQVRYVSIKDVHMPLSGTPAETAAARAEFDHNDLQVLSGGVIRFDKDDDGDIRAKFDYAKAARLPIIVCMPSRAALPRVEKFVKEYDIRIAVHNHGPEDPNFPTPESALAALKDMDPRCGVCIDCGHAARAGSDVVESIQAAGSRLLDMHIKDLRSFHDVKSQCDVGDGIMPVPAMFRQLQRMNYRGGVMLEYEINENSPMPGMQRSLAYMRGVMAGLAAQA